MDEVKLPSDELPMEEVRAMNSGVKVYNLNKPMDWATFKELPEDLLKEYLNKIRQRFHPTDANIADMLGVSPGTLSMLLKKYKLNAVYDQKAIRDLDGWNAWLAGEDISLVVPTTKPKDAKTTKTPTTTEKPSFKITPHQGTVTIEGDAAEALLTLSSILVGHKARLTIEWELQ